MKALLLIILAVSAAAQEVSVEDAMRMVAAGRLAEGEAALRALAAKEPRDADLRYRLGLVLVKQNRLDDAAKVLVEATRIEPAFVFPWLALGDISFRRDDKVAAMAHAKRAEERAGESVLAWKALAVLEDRIGDSAGQARALAALVHLAPQDRDACVRLASLLLEHRNAGAARSAADSGLRVFPDDSELLRLRGLAWYGMGRKDEAMDSFLAAMDAAPADETVHASVETLLPDAGAKLPQVRERLLRFAAQRPDSPLGPFLLALASSSALASAEDQEALLRRAIAIDPNFWPAYFDLHRILRRQGSRPEAIEALETTLRLNPNHAGAHFALAQLYLEAGDRRKAQQHRAEHHRLRAAAASEEQKRSAEAPRFAVKVQ